MRCALSCTPATLRRWRRVGEFVGGEEDEAGKKRPQPRGLGSRGASVVCCQPGNHDERDTICDKFVLHCEDQRIGILIFAPSVADGRYGCISAAGTPCRFRVDGGRSLRIACGRACRLNVEQPLRDYARRGGPSGQEESEGTVRIIVVPHCAQQWVTSSRSLDAAPSASSTGSTVVITILCTQSGQGTRRDGRRDGLTSW